MLWVLGTLGGLAAAVAIPVLMFVRHDLEPRRTFATWLLPLVPPMVSAATGAALIPHLPGAEAQQAMLLACYAMFGLSLLATLAVLPLVWVRLAYHRLGPPQMVPTLWIVLGPLGQSITAAGLLGARAHGLLAEPYALALQAMGVLYGVPVWGFGRLAGDRRRDHDPRDPPPSPLRPHLVELHLPGRHRRHRHLGALGADRLGPLAWAAVALYLLLLGAWATAFAHTLRGAWTGAVFALVSAPTEPVLTANA